SSAFTSRVSYPAAAIPCWIFAAFVEELLKLTVSIFLSTSQFASPAPAFFAAVSIFFLHISQLPETGMLSVVSDAFAFCAKEKLTVDSKKANKKACIENILSAFINN